ARGLSPSRRSQPSPPAPCSRPRFPGAPRRDADSRRIGSIVGLDPKPVPAIAEDPHPSAPPRLQDPDDDGLLPAPSAPAHDSSLHFVAVKDGIQISRMQVEVLPAPRFRNQESEAVGMALDLSGDQ